MLHSNLQKKIIKALNYNINSFLSISIKNKKITRTSVTLEKIINKFCGMFEKFFLIFTKNLIFTVD